MAWTWRSAWGDLSDSGLIRRRIGFSSRVAVASRGYLELRGAPLSPFDLAHHDCIVCMFQGSAQDRRFEGPGSPIVITPPGRLKINDSASIRNAVLAGLGVAHTPAWLFADKISSGEVAILLKRWHSSP
jgi:DNA-binding transcriptional LysR family regulator